MIHGMFLEDYTVNKNAKLKKKRKRKSVTVLSAIIY